MNKSASLDKKGDWIGQYIKGLKNVRIWAKKIGSSLCTDYITFVHIHQTSQSEIVIPFTSHDTNLDTNTGPFWEF